MAGLYVLGFIFISIVVCVIYSSCVMAGRADDWAGYKEDKEGVQNDK